MYVDEIMFIYANYPTSLVLKKSKGTIVHINQLQFGVLKSLIAFSIRFNLAAIREASCVASGLRSSGVVSVSVMSPISCT